MVIQEQTVMLARNINAAVVVATMTQSLAIASYYGNSAIKLVKTGFFHVGVDTLTHGIGGMFAAVWFGLSVLATVWALQFPETISFLLATLSIACNILVGYMLARWTANLADNVIDESVTGKLVMKYNLWIFLLAIIGGAIL